MKGNADLTSLRAIKESSWGVTPGSGNLVQIPYTGESLNANIETVMSKEIRSDRSTTDLVQVGQSAGGSFNIEMQFAAFDDFLEGALFSVFSAALTIVGDAGDISSTATGFSCTDVAKMDAIVPGQWFEVRGFSTNSGENNGFYQATVATDGTGIVDTAIAPPSIETPAAAAAEMHGQMLRNGITQHSYTVEKRLEGLVATTYQHFLGSVVASLSLNYSAGEILTGSIELLCKTGTMGTAVLAGLTDTPAPTNSPMNSVGDMENILIDGTLTDKDIFSMTTEIGNNLRGQKAIGNLGNVGIGTGKLSVGGNMSIYFEDKVEMDRYTGNNSFSLSYRLRDDAGNAYIFTFGKVKYENLTANSGGENTDVMAEGTWKAVVDPIYNTTIQIDKIAAA